MKWIDTHNHIYMLEPGTEQDDCWQRSVEEGVSRIIFGGVDRASIEPIKSFCLQHIDGAFATIGLHPTDVKENYKQELDFIEKELQTVNSDFYADPTKSRFKYVGIGETGLDFYTDRSLDKEQEIAFRAQISWAKKYNLPLVLHIRSAFEQSCNILKEEQDGSLRGVFHCFGGSIEQANIALDLGFYLGIGGVVTFKNAHLAQTVANISLDNIVLETDAPYLAPHPFRGRPNESSYIPIIGRKVADLKGVSVAEVAEVTTRNALNLFSMMGGIEL